MTLTVPEARTAVDRPARRLGVGWPLAALLIGYPVWWLLGLGPFVFILFAIPMALQMWRNRWLKLPPGWVLWGLFLVWVVFSVIMLDATAPNTLDAEGFGRYIAFGMRLANYLAVTVILLYVGNLPTRLVSTLRITRWLSILFLVTVVGGWLGLFLANASFTSPMSLLLPSALTDNDYVSNLLTPSFAQVQTIIGEEAARPSAPYEFSNAWGNNLSLLLVWFVVSWWSFGSARRRLAVPFVLIAALVPLIYSLNRGVWLGIILIGIYAVIRLALQANIRATLIGVMVALITVPVVLLSPLGTVISERLDNPHSNEIRSSLAAQSVSVAASSPVLGYGSTRNTIGSERSATIGQTTECPRCGNRVIGSTGQLWLVLVSQGIIGAFLYVAFFVYSFWIYRRDGTSIGIGGTSVVLLALFSMFFYTAIASPLALTMISIGLLWRNRQEQAEPQQESEAATAESQ